MKPHAAQAKRLAYAIAGSGLTNAAAADAAGMPRQVLANMLAGNVPGRAHLPKLAEVLKVPMEWLATGAGSSVGEKVELYALRLSALKPAKKHVGIAVELSSRDAHERAEAVKALKGEAKAAYEAYSGLNEGVPSVVKASLSFELLLAVIPALLLARNELRKSKKASRRRLAWLEHFIATLAEDCPGFSVADGWERILEWSARVNDAQRAFEDA